MSWEGLNPPYRTIVADPPWHYEPVEPPKLANGYSGRVGLPYSSMTLLEVAELRVDLLADSDARLFLWTTNRHLRQTWDVMEAWGFKPNQRVLVWCKTPLGTNPVTTEFILMGKRGRPAALPWHGTTWFDWPRSSHSVKPAAFLDLVESWSPGPYVELFARQPRLGWDHWGYGIEGAA